MSATIKIGDVVGAERWPYSAAHPDCWQQPLSGVVLAVNDVRAWANTLRFRGTPTQEAVDKHLANLRAKGELLRHIPVLWDFGAHGSKVWWEPADRLRPYDKDVEAWRAARAKACRSKLVAANYGMGNHPHFQTLS
ncbi:MAG: hypothetical protein AMXMBFR13_06860 [Phycisphaerae bacterium]